MALHTSQADKLFDTLQERLIDVVRVAAIAAL